MKDVTAPMHHQCQPGTSRLLFSVTTLLLVMLTASAVGPVSAQATPTTDEAIVITGTVKNSGPVTVAELKTLPNETIDVTYTASGESQDHTFVGTPLLGVLDQVGIDKPEGTKNPLLSHYMVVTAKDGYQLIISGGELDPAFGNTEMYLAWEQDGTALTGDEGPIRLVVPGDTKGGRYVSGIVSIEVLTVGEAAATPTS